MLFTYFKPDTDLDFGLGFRAGFLNWGPLYGIMAVLREPRAEAFTK